MFMKLFFSFLALLLCTSLNLLGADIVIRANQNTRIDGVCYYFFDQSKTRTIEYAAYKANWRSSKKDASRYLVTNDAIWLKASIVNETGEPIYCRIDNPRLDSVDIYIQSSKGDLYLYNSIGNASPISNRAFYSSSLISKLPIDSASTVYFRIVSNKRINYPLFIGTSETMLNFVLINTMLDCLYFGAALIILLYNFFIYLSLKDKASAYYFMATLCMVTFLTFWKGYLVFFHPSIKLILFHYSNLFAVLSIVFLLLFSIHFLKIKALSILLYRYYFVLIVALFGVYIALIYTTDQKYIEASHLCFSLLVMMSLVSMLGSAIFAAWKKIVTAWLYLLGFFFNVICIAVFLFPLAGVIDYSPFYSHIVPLGSILDTICLSIALSYNLISLKKEKEIVFLKNIIEAEKLRKKTEELKESDRKMAEYKLMALRSVMNPHFLFNSLNSIQFYISKNDKLNALNYLSEFSQLIRAVLNSSIENLWPLAEEIKLLNHFIVLEKLRLDDELQVYFHIGKNIDPDRIIVPSLILQPYVENAIEHGLLNKKRDRVLTISLMLENDILICLIEDNGVGREASQKANIHLDKHKPVAMSVTEERLKLINKDAFLSVQIIDLNDESLNISGTRVEIKIAIRQV
jgi:sensor histidine kinase YesM